MYSNVTTQPHGAVSGPTGRAQLARSLRLADATALVVGTIIGALVFVQASEITALVPSIPIILLAWTVAGILTLFGAMVCAELATAFPRAGGVYVFLRETFGPLAGFLWGWSMFWIMHSGIISVMAMVFARYIGFFTPLDDRGIRAVAIVTILVISGINYFGVKFGGRLQTTFTFGKVLAVVLLLVVGFTVGSHLPAHFRYAEHGSTFTAAPVTGEGFLLALIAGLFTFGGWHIVTYTAEETIDPERTIPRALMIGIGVATACYVALNAVYFYVLPLDRVAASPRVAADAAVALIGSRGGAVISALVAFSSFGAMSGSILAAPRVYFAMARDRLVFRWIGDVHPRFQTPYRAILLQAVWASVLVWTGTYRQLFSRVIFIEWAFFAVMAAGVFVLRRRPNYRPVYRMWGYPWVPIAFIVASAAIVIDRLRSQPLDSVLGLALVALGIPVYFAWRQRRTEGRS